MAAQGYVTYPTAPTGQTAGGGLYATGSNEAFNNMFLQGYMPILFAKATMKEFNDASILPRICNVQFEAQFKQMGDKIYIRKKPDISIGEYKVGKNVSYQELEAPAPIEVVIDKGYDWAFREHDVVTQQTDIKQYISELMTKIAQRIRDYIEPTALSAIVDNVVDNQIVTHNAGTDAGIASRSYNLGTTGNPIDLSATGDKAGELSVAASNVIADLYGVLKEQNVLEDGKTPFVVAPHRFLNVLAKSAIQNASFADGGSTQRRGQAAVGMIQGCELYTSNYVRPYETTGGLSEGNTGGKRVSNVFPVICGTTDAVTWAQTITKVEKLRDQNKYADLHRGMGIYGYKVVEPKALAVAWVSFSGTTVKWTEFDRDGNVFTPESGS